jgi:hypothetical protein
MKPKTFNPTSDHPARAVQAWQILIAAAANRQTYTYQSLSIVMYQKEAAGVLDKILGHIAFFCKDHGLPVLTAIVVGKGRGTPGHDIPADGKTMDKLREKVYATDWYDIYPPTTKQLADAFAKPR